MNTPLTYAASGVDIHAGDTLSRFAVMCARRTYTSSIVQGPGQGLNPVLDLSKTGVPGASGLLVTSLDGVGTKVKLASATGLYNGLGYDLVAMCVNDMMRQGATPISFGDYYGTPFIDPRIGEAVLEGIAVACVETGIPLVGGEIAELGNTFEPGAFEMVGVANGLIDPRLTFSPEPINVGDVVFGLYSSGVHSNGFSLVRKIIERANLQLDKTYPDFLPEYTLGEALMSGTEIYVGPVSAALKTGKVKGLAHITGGGIAGKPANMLANSQHAISFHLQQFRYTTAARLFAFLQQHGGVDVAEMRRTFNMGYGIVGICSSDDFHDIRYDVECAGGSIHHSPIGIVTARESDPVIFIG